VEEGIGEFEGNFLLLLGYGLLGLGLLGGNSWQDVVGVTSSVAVGVHAAAVA
jgi:hypothetical protein